MDRSQPIRPRPHRHVGGRGGRGPPRPPQQHQNPCNPHSGASTRTPTPALLMRPQDHHHHPQLHQQHLTSNVDRLERIDRAVAKARCDLLAAGESVSSWKVSQAAVLALQVDSWSSLGFSMQQVPSLGSLMAVEGKINAFIHCFVETRRITSLYDLERAICKNEGIERFEELELGPFLRYPLVMHYFSLNSDMTEVFEITSEEIVCHLGEFLAKLKSKRHVDIGELLSFIAKEKSVSGVEKLGVRIRNLGLHISFILDAKRSEVTCLRAYLKGLKQQANGKQPDNISMPLEEDFVGKVFNFVSLDDEDGDNLLNEDKKHDNGCNRDENSGQNMLIDASPSRQVIEGKTLTHAEWLKRDMEERHIILENKANYNKKGRRVKAARLVLETVTMKSFMESWKEACRTCSLSEVIEIMLNMYVSQKKRGKFRTLLREYPLVGLLNVAVTCIKCGMLEEVYDAIDKQMLNGITLPIPLPESKDIQSSLESATDNARHRAEHTTSIISKHACLSHLCSIRSYLHNWRVNSQTVV